MPLDVGPMKIDASDPDLIGNISGLSGVRYDADELVKANAAQYAPLTPILALSRDADRSETLDLDEVGDVVGGEVEGASVRGTGRAARQVVYLVRYPSGRSAKGAEPYEPKVFPKSEAAYQEKVTTDLRVATAAKASGASEAAVGEDPRVAVLQAKLKELEEVAEAAADPEPFAGYADLNVEEVTAKIEAASDPVEREILKRQIRTYEESHKPRKGVIQATEPTALAPVEDPDA